MNGEQAIEYINSFSHLGSKPGLGRTRELLQRLGDPQNELRFVHVAGTNGKGSTSAMLYSILRAAGYSVGLYTSPYLLYFNESISVDGADIDGDSLAVVTEKVRDAVASMAEQPTVFELKTALAFEYFRIKHCDYVVCEVGMGGRLDSTNVIPCPAVAVITNIGLDHMAQLGNTVELIAAEKAGIIKHGGRVAAYDLPESVKDVIADIARERGADLCFADFDNLNVISDSLSGQRFTYCGDEYALPLLGENQRNNAALAIEAVNQLRLGGCIISDEALARGLSSTIWPGRFELSGLEPAFIIDGGHNPQCAKSVADNLRRYFPNQKAVFIIGVLADKDYRSVLDYYYPIARAFFTLTPNSERALSADSLCEIIRNEGKIHAQSCKNAQTAINIAREFAGPAGLVCATGSLYMIGEIRCQLGLVR